MISLSQELKIQQKLTPQQIQILRLLQVPIVSLEQTIKEEIERNPLLEDDSDDNYTTENDNNYETECYDNYDPESILNNYEEYMEEEYSYREKIEQNKDQQEKNIIFASEISFQDYIIAQFNLKEVSEKQRIIGLELIGNINKAGYMERNLESIVNDIAFSQGLYVSVEEVEAVLTTIQSLEPAGIGARDLQECLSIQLHRMEEKSRHLDTAIKVIDKYFDLFSKKHYNKIEQKLKVSEAELCSAIDLISTLNPRPCNGLADESENNEYIVPDFVISQQDSKLSLYINRNTTSLKINRQYVDILKEISKTTKPTKEQKETAVFIKEKAEAAKLFIDAIEQRYKTLEITMAAIMNYQKEYFLSGDINDLRPMLLKDIAKQTNFDISTISRVINQKYVQTDFGTIKLKKLFSKSHIGEDGTNTATETIKSIIVEYIKNEDKTHPLSDEELTELLHKKGFRLSRRTVSKYREKLNIPVQRLRKEIRK